MQIPLGIAVRPPREAYDYGNRTDGGTHGLVLTKPHLVDLILDLAGYRAEADLTRLSLLDPACGHGAFVVRAVERLLTAARSRGVRPIDLRSAIATFDIDAEHVATTQDALLSALEARGVDEETRRTLVSGWVQQDDFLLADCARTFDVVVGNPPYVRIEQLAPALQAEYRRLYATLFDRADLYVAFIERGLHLLSPAGVLSFVCADRWTLNKYGGPLRGLLAAQFNVRAYIDLHRASPFESDVIAYPSIFVIARGTQTSPVAVVSMATASPEECKAVRARLAGAPADHPGVTGADYEAWFTKSDPWVLSSPEQLATLRALEARFPALEADGRTAVRIGVATGNDAAYIVASNADIESDRLVPLVMRDDLNHGRIEDAGRCVINTSGPTGTVDLAAFPRLARHLATHEDAVRRRHVARKNGETWFRTIDRVYPELVARPKLLIPDIGGSNEIVFDHGCYYPHHNLYFVLSDAWDLEVLGGLLSSRVALFFVWSYAVKMRGGYLRFQAQYLRRIRVPPQASIPLALTNGIRAAFRARDFTTLDELAAQAYGLPQLPEFAFVDTRK